MDTLLHLDTDAVRAVHTLIAMSDIKQTARGICSSTGDAAYDFLPEEADRLAEDLGGCEFVTHDKQPLDIPWCVLRDACALWLIGLNLADA